MIPSQMERLAGKTGGYLSIGITEGGEPRSSFGVPWVHTSHTFNMRTPDVFLAPEDLQDAQIIAALGAFQIIGCYVYAAMDCYDFLAQFTDLKDLTILNGDAIRNLDFLESLTECSMLYLQNAQLQNLDTIVNVKLRSGGLRLAFRCIGLDNCTVEDLSIFETADVHFSEFLIWNPTGRNERDRWVSVSASTKRYYEFQE